MLGGINNQLFLTSLMGFLVVGIFILILKWAFSSGKSLIERPKKIGKKTDYGLLVEAAAPKNLVIGEMMRQHLMQNGIKANLTQTSSGTSVMVFSKDLKIAKNLLTEFADKF
jgi:hypothetical protein